jgi:pilus assembly protein Flp/PilA
MFNNFKSFVRDENGATMIEYGLIAALVSVAAIVALGSLGTTLSGMFTHVSACLTGAQSGGTGCAAAPAPAP